MASERKSARRRRKKAGPHKWVRLSRRNHLKMMVVFFCIVLALAGMMGRLMYIEHTSGPKYQKIVLAQANYGRTIPYRRGDILDRNGIELATSLDVYNVILDCSVITSKEEYLEPTMKALLTSFPQLLSETEIRTFISENPDNRYKVLAKRLPYDDIQVFLEKQNDKDSKTAKNIKGVWFEKEYQRNYPYKSLASSVIGFTTSGNVGMAGLENYYNSTLNGMDGRQYGYLNSDNSMEKTIKNAVDGNNIVTTIDMNIQSVVEAKIKEFNRAYKDEARPGDGAEKIGVIIENPNTGEILSMAQSPDYDLSNPRSLEGFYSKEDIEKMSEKETADALNQIWRNFCISDTFEPGSTQKPLTVAAGLDSGKLTAGKRLNATGLKWWQTGESGALPAAGTVRKRCRKR